MKKRLTSFILVLVLSFSLFSVSASAEFTSTDSRTLTDIYKIIQYLNLSPGSWQRNSVIGFLERILNAIPSNLSTNFALQGGDGTNAILDGIRDYSVNIYNYLSGSNISGNLGNIQRNTLAVADRVSSSNTLLGSINNAVSGINGFATESTLSSLHDFWLSGFATYSDSGVSFADAWYSFFGDTNFPVVSAVRADGSVQTKKYTNVFSILSGSYDALTADYKSLGKWSLYHYVKNLSETLASEDDKQLAENYKENRVQAEQDFLNGQSGPTSLGKGDFSNASQVGGVLNDTFNMGGASKVSDFLSGFGSAGTESQAWFSQTTANNLNAVEASDGTSGVSTFADDGETMVDVDPDPYNMANIFERYDWLEGVNVDD